MKRFSSLLLAASALALVSAPHALARTGAPDGAAPSQQAPEKALAPLGRKPDAAALMRQHKRFINSLYERLSRAEDEEAAKPIEQALWKAWLHSGSATVDLLMEQALSASNEKNNELAMEILDAVVEIEPDYAEAWNRRATLHYLKDDYYSSLADIQKVLAIEPRHFGALSGLGLIMRSLGDDKAALFAFREALKHNPFTDGAKDAVDELTVSVEGRKI